MVKWPDELKEEMPLPDGWCWQDESFALYAALKDKENNEAYAWVRHNQIVWRDDVENTDYVTIEDAMRLIYAKFLFVGMEGEQYG